MKQKEEFYEDIAVYIAQEWNIDMGETVSLVGDHSYADMEGRRASEVTFDKSPEKLREYVKDEYGFLPEEDIEGIAHELNSLYYAVGTERSEEAQSKVEKYECAARQELKKRAKTNKSNSKLDLSKPVKVDKHTRKTKKSGNVPVRNHSRKKPTKWSGKLD